MDSAGHRATDPGVSWRGVSGAKVGFAVMLMMSLGHSGLAPAHQIGVSTPQYDSPGGTVPAIVTAYHVPSGYSGSISARGTGGAVARCRGEVWINRVRHTASRKCYLRLPRHRGAFGVVARARLGRPDSPMIERRGAGGRPVQANGYESSRPMSLHRIEEIERCFNTTDRVWLTFDDGGSRVQVTRILAILARNGVRGRFFFTGVWAARNPDLVRRIRGARHLFYNHSYDHRPLSQASAFEIDEQIRKGLQSPGKLKLLRPPFAAGALTTRLERLARVRGHRLCRWTVDTYDWQKPSVARMVERIRTGDEMTPPIARGGNILMHGTATHTAYGLQHIIDAVHGRGLTLDQLPR